MDSDAAEMVNEVQSKVILHWNCRDFIEFPEVIRIYGSHIQEIYLKWNKLTTLPPWIIELFNVTNLYLYGNLIKELPQELGNMSQLTVLDLTANKLEKIPPCLGNLANLKSLLLNDNFIERLPNEMEQLHSLEVLSVNRNKLIALPEWIGSWQKLKVLNVDVNYLRELPNRLTLSPEISIISVSLNRLRFLPMNGFVSSPVIRFDGNANLNYLSYPLLFQLLSHVHNMCVQSRRISLGCGSFEETCQGNNLNQNIKLKVRVNLVQEGVQDLVIELPRQLLKVHNIYDNITVSLWELALRKVYSERYTHILSISTSPLNVSVSYEQIARNNRFEHTVNCINHVSYNLLLNGPASICVNFKCKQPIFTEAWVITGLSEHAKSITTVALCCCRRCALEFVSQSHTINIQDWTYVQ